MEKLQVRGVKGSPLQICRQSVPLGGSRGAKWGATQHDIRRSPPDKHGQPMPHQGCSQGPTGGLS